MAKKTEKPKEPILTDGAIRLRLRYFTDGIYVAIFNTREALIWDAKLWLINRGVSADELQSINDFIDAGIMSIFKTAPSRVARLFVFRLARITDDYFSSGKAANEQERQDLFNRTTADGLDSKKLKTLFYIDGVNLKLIEVEKRDLKIHSGGGAQYKDGRDFDPLSGTKRIREMFGSLSAAQVQYEKDLNSRVEFINKAIAEKEVERAGILGKLTRLQQDTAVYLKPSSDKKPETFGKIRI